LIVTKRGHTNPVLLKSRQNGYAFLHLAGGAIDHNLKHFAAVSNRHSRVHAAPHPDDGPPTPAMRRARIRPADIQTPHPKAVTSAV
jgi:hypothetical protein